LNIDASYAWKKASSRQHRCLIVDMATLKKSTSLRKRKCVCVCVLS